MCSAEGGGLDAPLELIAGRLVHYRDDRLKWSLLGLGSSGATAMLDAIVSANLAFLVFTFGSLLVASSVLGPMAAVNGVLLFGCSTAVIFEVLRRSVARTGNDAAGLPTYDAVPPRINSISGD